jgi:activator of HSP90 ATPase
MSRSVIQQSVVLLASAERLFDMYLDPEQHGAFTGTPVVIGAQPGATFSAFGGQLSGSILAVLPHRLIIQSWRSTKFLSDDPNSTLILSFATSGPDATSGRIDLIHLDVPAHDYQDVVAGWEKYYWRPWRAYLQR